MVAAELSAAGKDVIVLEEGGYYNEADFNQLELAMMRKLYYQGGFAATADAAIALIAGGCLGGGTLVNSVYSDDSAWVGDFLAHGGGGTGRLYIGSGGAAADAPGSGAALPQTLHGGPGRAGGGEELGGLVGVKLYLQRVAVQGSKRLVDSVVGTES